MQSSGFVPPSSSFHILHTSLCSASRRDSPRLCLQRKGMTQYQRIGTSCSTSQLIFLFLFIAESPVPCFQLCVFPLPSSLSDFTCPKIFLLYIHCLLENSHLLPALCCPFHLIQMLPGCVVIFVLYCFGTEM